jgi:chaperonin GroEL
VIVAQILDNKNPSFGWNAATGEFGDMYKMGIIDPTKVSKTALQNAASVAGLALTTDVLITEIKDKGEDTAAVTGAIS